MAVCQAEEFGDFKCLRHPSGETEARLLPRAGRHCGMNNRGEGKPVELKKACVYLSEAIVLCAFKSVKVVIGLLTI